MFWGLSLVAVRVASLQAGAVARTMVQRRCATWPWYEYSWSTTCRPTSAPWWLPDLVLMDVHLPGIDGLEVTRRLLLGVHPRRRAALDL